MSTVSLSIAGFGLAVWFFWLWRSGRLDDRFSQMRVEIRRPHAIQLVLQLTLFLYWGLYWDEVWRRAPLIVAQLIFAYFFEMLLTWTRGKAWHLRLAPFPIVFSINLFLWFREEVFYLQLLLIAVAYLAKELITWERDGRRVHIFNPSAFPLALASLWMMMSETVGLTYGLDLIWSFSAAPHFFELIFLLGLVVQLLFSTTLITFGAAAMMCLLHTVSAACLGSPLSPHPFDAAVFLGLTLLVTDPATSPRRALGKLLFGMLYGVGVFTAYLVLRLMQEPSFFDKILVVPAVNLLVPWCESAGQRLSLWWPVWRKGGNSYGSAIAIGLYVVFFLWIVPALKDPRVEFEDRLPAPPVGLSPAMTDMKLRTAAYRLAYPGVYRPFTFIEEYRRYRRLGEYAPQTADEFTAMGRTLLDLQQFDQAHGALQTAVQLDPQSALAHLHLGNALLRSGQLPGAISQFEVALGLAPNDAETHLNLGTARGMQGQVDQAVDHLRKSALLQPGDFTTQINLGGALLQQGRVDESVESLRQAVRLKPASGVAHLHLGNALAAQGSLDEAEQHLLRALDLMPGHPEARQLLSDLARQRRRRTMPSHNPG